MKKRLGGVAILSVGILSRFLLWPTSGASSIPPEAEITQRLSDEITHHGQSFSNLESFTSIGPRLCGSAGASRAVEWAKSKLESYGLDRVWLQPVQIPVWTRGDRESAAITSTKTPLPLRISALGNSTGTPAGGIEAAVIEVKSLDEVVRLGSRVKGKIVFYNRPMDPSLANTFDAYGQAADQRFRGPALASKYGAIAVLVRSLTTLPDDPHPHTGVTGFRSGVRAIPSAAISTHDANLLSQWIQKNSEVRVRLELSAKSLPQNTSYNVIGEIKGAEIPEEIVAVGGHLDSWDLSPGAHDDGAGVVQSIEVLRAFKAMNIRPKRTLRAVLFMCEEFGGIGADEYARQARILGEKHIVATESDRGGFQAEGFSIEDSTGRGIPKLRQWTSFLESLQATQVLENGSGTDVEPLITQGAVTFDLVPDSKHYFDLHHSELDQLSTVVPSELDSGAAALAVLTYLASEQGI